MYNIHVGRTDQTYMIQLLNTISVSAFICYALFTFCRTGDQTIMLPISNISPSHKCPANNTLECKAVLAKSAIISIYGSTLTMIKVKIPSYYGSSEVKLQKVYV